jgi:hypothetical protein
LKLSFFISCLKVNAKAYLFFFYVFSFSFYLQERACRLCLKKQGKGGGYCDPQSHLRVTWLRDYSA